MSSAYATILRLAGRPQGVRNDEVRSATWLTAQDAGSRLAQYARTGTLVRVRVAPLQTHFFVDRAAAAAFKARIAEVLRA